MTSLVWSTASELTVMIRDRTVSACEVLDAHLAQIAERDPDLNAIVTLDPDARTHAEAADAATVRGETWGVLHGVPVTIKDLIETAGMRTTAGHLALKDYVPTADAPVVARLRAAGAIILGKTNPQELGMGAYCVNPVFGRTNNPWDLDRTPGGSTGGGAAAVAAGMCPVTIGSDAGGSVRIPAHFCGVYALKPTQFRVPTTGHIPEFPGMLRTVRNFATIGPLARGIDDLELTLRIIAGPDGYQWDMPPVALEPTISRTVESLRVVWTDGWVGAPVDAATRAAIGELVQKLADVGATVEPADTSAINIDHVMAVCYALFGAEIAPSMPPSDGEIPNVIDYANLLGERDALTRVVDTMLAGRDALVLPVAASSAFPHEVDGVPVVIDGIAVETMLAAAGHTFLFNLTGHPAVVIPLALSDDGMPIGVQIVGRRWGEIDLLGVVRAIETVTQGFRQPTCA